MFAMLFPEKLADAAMAEVERMANDPVPHSKRPARIAALEREIDELSHVEEALIEAAIARGEAVHRSPSAPPQACSASGSRSVACAPHNPPPGRTHARAVPLGRWTAINSREPAGWTPSGRGRHPASCLATVSVRFRQHRR
jgi:hypothetical protein